MHITRLIERFLQDQGLPPRKFGRLAAGDPRLVLDIRMGARSSTRNGDEIAAFHSELWRAGRHARWGTVMSRRTKTRALLQALRTLIPTADVSVLHERPWHNLTTCGAAIGLCVAVIDVKILGDAEKLSQKLPEHEFVLPGQIVADIAVTRAVVAEGA